MRPAMSGTDTTFEQARAAFLQGVQAHEAGRLDEAESAYERARALLPGRPSTLLNLAQVRLARGRPEAVAEALAPLLAAGEAEARVLATRAAEALHQRGQARGRAGDAAAALADFEAALAHDATLAAAWTQRGSLLREAGRLAEAADCFRQALAHGGDPALNGWFLAAVEGRSDLQAPARYVQALFDGYAEGFDEHLVHGLGYRVPEQLAALLPAGPLGEALDLGCGTGLCAAALQGRVAAIDGVDLAPRMVAAARARGLYRQVHEAALEPWLQACTTRYTLVIAADVFIYIGDLAPVFAGVRRVLAPGGRFAFSVEAAATGVELGTQLRYRHGEDHLRALAAASGFAVERVEPAVLRHEQQRPIAGRLLRLRVP